MKNKNVSHQDTKLISNLGITVIILIGVIFIAISLLIPIGSTAGYFHELLKELGIVLFSVFAVSWIYERLVTKRLLSEFNEALKTQINDIENISATCSKLGIHEIFPTRELYEFKYPFNEIVSKLESGSEFKIIARSLFHLMNKPEPIKNALTNGIHFKLCLFDPKSTNEEYKNLPDLEPADIEAAISTFKKYFIEWLTINLPNGTIEIRYHKVHLFDSYTTAKLGNRFHGIWDLSFGRSLTEKRIIVVESNQGVGANLSKRYNYIWDNATTVFKYENKMILVNTL